MRAPSRHHGGAGSNKPTAAPCGAAVGHRREGGRRTVDHHPAAGCYAAFASDFRSSMLAIAHLVSTAAASLCAFITISPSSLALVTASS